MNIAYVDKVNFFIFFARWFIVHLEQNMSMYSSKVISDVVNASFTAVKQ